ncbi:hypothetical protein MKW92_032582 [Papaver armeniacum]|nr:hypothetical protein MKW92_032582 [Papaver armeniacum]
MSKTTSLCFSPLFIGLIFILAALMNSEGVDGVKCTVIPFTDATCDFMCRNHFGENVPILWWRYYQDSIFTLDKSTCTCCVDDQYLTLEGLHTCVLVPFNYLPGYPSTNMVCLANCQQFLGEEFPISSAQYIYTSLNLSENNTCQCCKRTG